MTNELKTDICIVGSGPGGATLAMILARLGINVILVEKSSNINREFRGESISPDSVAILEK
jgi:2-polyprenyl-6-methoxyphenol hydroxylase-like FAD-dependent oxidoreductase